MRRSLLGRLPANEDKVEPNLLPLIDVVFLLLIFFMVTSTFISHKHLNINLPQVASHARVTTNAKEVVIGVDEKGNYTVNSKYLADNSSETLVDAINSFSNNKNNLPLVISADAKANYQSVILVLDVVGTMGFVNIRLSVRDKTK